MKKLFYPLLLLAMAGLLWAPHLILGAPHEASMGFIATIFYFHVPACIACFLGTFVCAGGSAAYLFGRSEAGDRVAVAAAELTVLFGIMMLVTGPLWAR
jgi:heme exporter protein C